MARVLAVANQKGGVAKTTTVVNLAAALVERGDRVLVVDLDAQACATFSLGLDPEDLDETGADVFMSREPQRELADLVVRTADGVDLLPASIDLAGLDVYDDEGSTSLTITDYRDLQDVAPRMALTEVGPRGSTSGAWSPTVITDTLRSEGLYAAFALLWRDEPQPGNRYQISSLDGGVPWLESCPNGLCSLGAQ